MNVRLTDEDLRDFWLFDRFRGRNFVENVHTRLFDGVLDHRAAKADERDTCHDGYKGYPSLEQE